VDSADLDSGVAIARDSDRRETGTCKGVVNGLLNASPIPSPVPTLPYSPLPLPPTFQMRPHGPSVATPTSSSAREQTATFYLDPRHFAYSKPQYHDSFYTCSRMRWDESIGVRQMTSGGDLCLGRRRPSTVTTPALSNAVFFFHIVYHPETLDHRLVVRWHTYSMAFNGAQMMHSSIGCTRCPSPTSIQAYSSISCKMRLV